ncbi:hypothetical protein C2845_PM18G02080 [Panicum miliaceum]|uniref:Uncharacterized protein n=1 Tax=Panicum miliaceum TaxID=4540 RepID=A0A3L6PNJ6_PANMI|nr:hypothetical protein C2845_PM18G02080 [Panicum miliaceum]
MAGQDGKEYVPQNKGIRKAQNLLDCNLLSSNGNPNARRSHKNVRAFLGVEDKMSMGAAAVAENDAPGPGEGKHPPSAALPNAAVAGVCVSSLLFGALAPQMLHRRSSAAGDEEPAARLSAVVWRLAPLVCAYLFSWTVALSVPRAALADSFVRASYLPLLASAAAEQAGPVAGAATMFLATAYSAAATGRALAQRRLAGAGAGPSAASTLRAALVLAGVFAATALAALLSLIARLVADGGGPAPTEVSPEALALGGIMSVAGPVVLVAALPLLDRLPGGPVRDTGVATVPALGAPVFVLLSLGETAMVVVVWVGGMAMTGHFGYCLAVHARYQQLFAIERTPPASGATRGTPAQLTSRRPPAGGVQ